MHSRCAVTLIFLAFHSAYCARILAVFPAPGYSQFILCEKLMGALARRGHQVTVISPYEPEGAIENYRTIRAARILDSYKDVNLFATEGAHLFAKIISISKLGHHAAERTLSDPNVQELIQGANNETFDLVIIEQFYAESLTGFAKLFSAPLVLFSSIGLSEWSNGPMGNPTLPSFHPLCHLGTSSFMSASERLYNLIGTIFHSLHRHFTAYPAHQRLMDLHFPGEMNLNEIVHNASLLLLNSHPTTSGNAPLLEGMVPVGGFHVDAAPLPAHVRHFLDGADDGAILFSMGTNLRSSQLDNATRADLIGAFARLRQRVVWKFEAEVPDLPPNVLVAKWVPQTGVLAHPRLQLFITHGGLLSTTEAVFFAKPMVGIPVFGDQHMNVARAVRNGIAVEVAFRDLNGANLLKAVGAVIGDERYRDNAAKLSNLLRDQPTPPRDLAVYWIERVIRQRGLHLKPSTLQLRWFQYYMIDILLILLAILIVPIWIIGKLAQKCYMHSCRKMEKKKHE